MPKRTNSPKETTTAPTPTPAPAKASGRRRGRGSTKEPHEASNHAFKVPRNRKGLPCGRCLKKKAPCALHGGKSTGPKTAAGKARASRNAVTHGLRRTPKGWHRDLSPEQRASYDQLVALIVDAENLQDSPLDRLLVHDVVRTEMMLEDGAAWLLKNGLTKDTWRRLKAGEEYIQENDTDGEPLKTAAVPTEALEAFDRLVKLKARLHERLRANSGKLGDSHGPIPVKVLGFDPSGFPEPSSTRQKNQADQE